MTFKDKKAELDQLASLQEDLNWEKAKHILQQLIEIGKAHYYFPLRTKQFKHTVDFIMEATGFIDYKADFPTRVWYILNDRKSQLECHRCGRPVRKQLKPIADAGKTVFWCSAFCADHDELTKAKISQKNKKKRNVKVLPPECKVIYRDEPIVYDDAMNQKLQDFFFAHRKTFNDWIKTEPELEKYLYEKSYPLDFTKLNVETRAYWVLHKMQKIPRCKTCGRQLDFCNVKWSARWASFCSMACMHKLPRGQKATHEINSRKFFDRYIANSPLVEPLFTVEEFILHNRIDPYYEYRCKCKKCGTKFKAVLNLNFLRRGGNCQTPFQCPKCFPGISSHCSSQQKEVLQFVREVLPKDVEIRNGDRTTLRPYELDIYIPSLQLAIEYDGLYWHSIECDKNKKEKWDYIKTQMCEEKGIKLVHIMEDDWLNNREETEHLIKEILLYPKQLQQKMLSQSLEVDRRIFSKAWDFGDYELVRATEPVLEERGVYSQKFHVWNCGTLIFRSKQQHYERQDFQADH